MSITLNKPKLTARILRARSQVGKPISYRLGKGGFDPTASHPDDRGLCDCTGFASWVLGLRRDQVNAKKPWSRLFPWIETTAVFADATGPKRLFRQIQAPVPGCLVVYGDKANSQGHIRVVSAVHAPGSQCDIDAIDCSSGQSKATGTAIHERDGGFFIRSGAIFVVLSEDVIL